MGNFNFKVGDKIQYREEVVEILALFGHKRNNRLFTGINNNGGISSSYSKEFSWQPYEEPKQKPKLQKFYCSDDDIFLIQFYPTKKYAQELWDYVYTESEFLKEFDVEI